MRTRCLFEDLERRCLLSAAVTGVVVGSTLNVTGTRSADNISIRVVPGKPNSAGPTASVVLTVISGKRQDVKTFNGVNAIVCNAGGGNDTVIVSGTGNVKFPVTVNGGGGNDTLSVSQFDGTATVNGDAGTNYLFGALGTTTFNVNAIVGSNPWIESGGADVIVGNGNDTVVDQFDSRAEKGKPPVFGKVNQKGIRFSLQPIDLNPAAQAFG